VKLTRLRIAGFKTFVEATDVPIEPGLTGVIGPNGCGKSNLVEALRWVMGETSHKNMRASGMDDVIFSGSGSRPARNMAEVLLVIENEDRRAPAAFNDADRLEVARRIEREAGSTYRINGREVRARDVQLLFADAATGARSPALVRQGQIAELIAAKPQARRRILEDAAGVAGLHARRHEAELRLKGAEDNLLRVEDVLQALDAQVDSLRRQGRQAGRYRQVSAEIRRLEALLAALAYAEAQEAALAAERQVDADLNRLAAAQTVQTAAATAQAVAAHALPGLRDTEVAAAAALQRQRLALAELDAEERRTKDRLAALERQITEIERDGARAEALRADADMAASRLAEEEDNLAEADEAAVTASAQARAKLAAAEEALGQTETALQQLQAQAATDAARRAALDQARREEDTRLARLATESARLEREHQALATQGGAPDLAALRDEAEGLDFQARQAEEAASAARSSLAAARDAELAARGPLAEADRRAQRLETEARTLEKLFARAEGDLWPRALDQITVAKGYETALGAALGDDLDASTNPSAPSHWAMTGDGAEDASLPEGVQALADLARAPAALVRRLRQIGVVEGRAEGDALRGALRPGQRLVSRAGDLWRWDGLTTAAEAPTPAARRLAERNRLGDLKVAAAAARQAADARRREAEAAQDASRASAASEAAAAEEARRTRRALDQVRERLGVAERRLAETASRRAALEEARARVAGSLEEAQGRRSELDEAHAALVAAAAPEAALLRARTEAAEARAQALDARAAVQGLAREAELRAKRREAVAAERRSWAERIARAEASRADLAERLARARAERRALDEAPAASALARRALVTRIAEAEEARKAAADRLAEGESRSREADRAARAALDALAAVREARAAAEARLEAARQRLQDQTRGIAETFETTPAALLDGAGVKPGAPRPDAAAAESRLAQLRADRERLGAVNLRAEDELAEAEGRHAALARERDDLVEAIKRLRQAIGSLNREGRERLLAAFTVVNSHFERLFTALFGGGTAELTLVDSDDPLEAGLEILARPPGKKPQTMTLLSGGEQALTAIALIFAVFLTNPSPICVLDEVDAPLDDANVERYCDLLDDMARQTETRFVVITHNPITMARMDRLFGVTMAERGVSQLVSVDLEGAERMLETV
jgi:chromosome segregation protein